MTEPDHPTRVALVEDDPVQRDALRRLLAAAPGLEVVAVCASVEEALGRLPDVAPEIVLMDIGLPGKSGIEGVRTLKPRLSATQFVMLTVFDDEERIFPALEAGASGYLLKATPPEKLLAAIREAREGGVPMTGSIARKVIAAFGPAALPAHEPLSPREREIVEPLSRGLLYKEIAERLCIGLGTVRTHIGRIYEKLHVRNRSEAAARAGRSRPHRTAG